jgi:hypothetical protein
MGEENFCYIFNGDRVEPEHGATRIHIFLKAHQWIENREIHTQLKEDLVEHEWLIHNTS